MRWNLIVKSAWHDLTKGRGLFIWLLVTLVWGCLIRLARIVQLVFSDPKVLIERTDMYSFFSAWQEYPFPSVCLLILALTQIYNYQNKVVQREVLAGLTRAEFFLRQYFYTGLLVVSQILFFFFYYFSTDLILRIVHGHFSYDFGILTFGHIIFEQFVANLFYCSLGLVFINLFRSYMLLLGYVVLAVVELIISYKLQYDPQLKPYMALLPLKSIELAFSTNFAKLNIIAGACLWVCVSIVGNAWHWTKQHKMNRDILKSALILCIAVPGILLVNFLWSTTGRVEDVKKLRFNRDTFLPLLDNSAKIAKAEIYVFNVWATWCPPCVEEIPALNKLQSRYSGPNVAFVALTDEDSTNTAPFFKKDPNRFTYLQCTDASLAMTYLESLNPDSSLKFSKGGTIPVNLITYHDKIVYYNIGADEENIHRMDSVLKKYNGLNP